MNRLLILAVLLSFVLVPFASEAGPGCCGSGKASGKGMSAGADCQESAAAACAKMVSKGTDGIVLQKELYPLETCLVSRNKLGDESVDHLYEGRLVRLCGPGCLERFRENPAAYLEKLDAAVIAVQSESYPLTTCPVSGMKLGSMGEPVDYVHEGRLVRFCCAGCIGSFQEDPTAAMALLEAAYDEKEQQAH
jgi:hypothetical protein